MKPSACVRALLVTILALAALPTLHAAPLVLHVATNGNDTAVGTREAPLATLAGARDRIRQLRQTETPPTDGITVLIHSGSHFQGEVLKLEEQDSGTSTAPIVYAAAPGETVLITAGKSIAGFTKVTDAKILQRLPEEARGQVMQTDLRKQGITDFGKIGTRTRQNAAGLELFCDDKPMTLARWPNTGFERIRSAPNGMKGGQFAYYGDRPKRWVDESDARGCGYWAHDWAASNVAFESIDTAKNTITTKAPHANYGYRKGGRYFAYNLLSEIDQPGEYYLDRDAGILYFWPPADLTKAKTEVSMGPGFLEFNNVSFVTFRKLVFQGCRGQAISVRDGEGVQIVGCTLRNLGTRAITITNGRNHRVAGCDLYDINEGGVSCSGGDSKTLTPSGHVVENCVFTRLARWQRTYVPAVQLSTVGARVSHNLMYDIPHSVVLFSGNDNIIEYNEVHTMGFEGGEMGAFYCGRNWTLSGNIIRYNYLHDIYNPCPQRNRAFMLDDGAAGITMYGNLIVRVAEGISLSSHNNAIDNNVFIDCQPAVGCWGGELSFPPFDIEHGHNKTRWPRLAELKLDEPPWSTRFPEMLPFREAIQNGGPVPPECYTRITRNIVWRGAEEWTGFHMTKDKDAWVIANNLTGTDPLFRNPEAGDYRLQDGSPAFAIGFEPIPVGSIGPQNTYERASWPIEHEVRKDVCQNLAYVRPPPPPKPEVAPIKATKISKKPVIDGALDKGEWSMPAVGVDQDAGGDIVISPSQAWVGYDDEALYVAFSNPVNGASPVDLGSAWGKSDAVEVALRKHTKKGGEPIIVLRGFAGGKFASSDEAQAPADVVQRAAQNVQYASKVIGPALWTCEWRVPFASLGIDPKKDREIEFNLTVRKVADNLWIMWAGTGGNSWKVDRASRVVFGAE